MAGLVFQLLSSHRTAFVILLFLCTVAVFIVKRVSSPIARLPGPFLTKLTVLPIVWHDHKSNRTKWTNELHAKYGPLVRISPHEVSICSQESIRDVFTGSSKTGYYSKAPIFNIFQHYGARDAFSSIDSESHAWRRRIVAANYAQSTIVAKEAKTGNLWKNVGNFIELIENQGISTSHSKDGSKSIDYFGACRFFAADNVTSHLFLVNTQALKGSEKSRRFIEASAERPGDIMTYFKMEFEGMHSVFQYVGRMTGFNQRETGRSRAAKASGKKADVGEAEWYGGSEIRDWGFNRFIDVRKAVEEGGLEPETDGPVAPKLAANAIAGDQTQGIEQPTNGDAGIRILDPQNEKDGTPERLLTFYRNEGCASECMDQFLAGLDTVGDTLSYIFYMLSIPESRVLQDRVRDECRNLDVPLRYNQPLSHDDLSNIQAGPWIEAVVKETLRLYPASTTALQRVVPNGGRFLDGLFVPGGTIIGASPIFINNAPEVFGGKSKYDINEWVPERWLDADPESLAMMNRRLWTFGSGGRGCTGKHLAILEMKLLLAGIYSRYITTIDDITTLPKPLNHPSQRSTFRDIDFFPDAKGIMAFAPSL